MNKIEDIIEKEGYYVSTSVGNSMLPFLRDRTDTVVIQKKTDYYKYDVVLYNHNNKYVLHRIIRVLDDVYHIRGDNCYYDEYIIKEDIIGALVDCYRGEQKVNLNSFSYKFYVLRRVCLYPIRHLLTKIKNKLKQL